MNAGSDFDDAWWYNVRSNRVEHGPRDPHLSRMGPYLTEDEAVATMDGVRSRREAWEGQDGT